MKRKLNQIFHALARRIGIDYMRYTASNFASLRRAKILSDMSIDLVLDVGANVGGYGVELREMGYTGRIISFEPLTQAFTELCVCATRYPHWECQNVAVGNQIGSVMINVSGRQTSSSLLPMTNRHIEVEKSSRCIAREEVKISKLDNLVPEDCYGPGGVFLKADVQGFEKEVLDGANRILPHVSVIELELSLTKLYEGSPLIDSMLTYLTQRGYHAVSLDPVMTDPRTGHVLQVNGIFLKRNATPEEGTTPS